MLTLGKVSRRFGENLAVDDLSFSVPDGSMTGFVGANGAGKTTTMRMVMGVLERSSGDIEWDGRPVDLEVRRAFGYMPEERGLYPKQKVAAQLGYLGELKGLSKQQAAADVASLLDRLGLAERAGSRLEELSLGNQQRVQIAASLLGSPRLLVLDEPFSGLDPVAVDTMADILKDAVAQGVSVLFSSHQLELVERLCDQLVILAKGRLVASGTVEQLRSSGPRRHRLLLGSDSSWVVGQPGVTVVSADGPALTLELADEAAGHALLREALSRGSVHEFRPIVPTVAELYREMTR